MHSMFVTNVRQTLQKYFKNLYQIFAKCLSKNVFKKAEYVLNVYGEDLTSSDSGVIKANV